MEIEKKARKILLMGLDNAGKTSILLSLNSKSNLMSFLQVSPTKGVKPIEMETFSGITSVWDFGGQVQYRGNYLAESEKFLEGATKLIFVIDIQDINRYDLALEYFAEILKKIEDSSIELAIYLHKYDPDLEENQPSIVNEKVPALKLKIKEIITGIENYEIFNTSIFAVFQKTPDSL